MDVRIKHPTTRLSWFDRISLVWMLVLLVASFVSAGFFMGASWMSDLDDYTNQVIAE